MSSPPGASPRRDAHRDAVASVVKQRDALIAAIRAETGLDQHAAEDVLSIVTVRVLANGAQTDPESWFRYMREAARRQASNERRAAVRAAARDESFIPVLADPPVDAVAARMVWLDAMADLAQLPDLERRVFWLRHYEGFSRVEIAAETGLTVSGVDVRLRQARSRLRQMLTARETHPAYLLLASFARPTARSTPLTAAPAAIAIGAALAIAVRVAAIPLPLVRPPALFHLPPGRVPSMVSEAGRAAPGATRDVTLARDDLAAGSSRRPGLADDATPVTLPPLNTCAVGVGLRAPVCVRVGDPAPAARWTGDRLTVTIGTQKIEVHQSLTPACEHVPTNDVVRCETGEPDSYLVPARRKGREGASGKVVPSAPSSGARPGGTAS